MNSKTADKERRPAGFLLGGTQRSFMRLVMVVQFHQIRAEISSALKNKLNWDLTSRSLLWSTVGPSEEPLGELRLHYWSPLVGTKSALLSHTEVKSEGRSDGPSVTAARLVHPDGPSQYTNQYILVKHWSRSLKQCCSDM